ncbi:MAG: HAD family hydrolase [Candidatus Nanopelagicales bacterium]
MAAPVIGFDLDMTLVDSAAGIIDSVQHVCRSYGQDVNDADIAATIGLPLDMVFPRWIPDVPYDVLLAKYRVHYGQYGVPLSRPLPGATEILQLIRAHSGRSIVVTAKHTPIAERVLLAAGLAADVVVGDLFAAAKAQVLLAEMAGYYVGDHPGDMTAAEHAGAVAIGVTTGPSNVDELHGSGAQVVLPDLFAVADWLSDRWRLAASSGSRSLE